MSKSRIVSTIAGMLIIAVSFSSCVYHSRGPAYDDYGYRHGYGYRYGPPPPRRVVVVPSPPPRVVYRDRDRRHHSGRSNRDNRNYRQYGQNGRGSRPR